MMARRDVDRQRGGVSCGLPRSDRRGDS
jgi:hypothetical protein